MNLQSDRSTLAFAAFDLWMSRQLEALVNQWITWAAPCDRGVCWECEAAPFERDESDPPTDPSSRRR